MEGRYFYDMNMIYIVNEKQMGAEVFIGFYVYNLKDKVFSSHQLFVIEAESRIQKITNSVQGFIPILVCPLHQILCICLYLASDPQTRLVRNISLKTPCW